jgi:pimeloyl-ACP methyl ester carboxylesterase
MRRILLSLLVVLAALLAANAVITDRETKSAKADIGRIVKMPGGDLQIREDGPRDGQPIVMLHGFAASMHWWTPTAQRLAQSFRVIRIDLLGHGGSEKPRDGYSMPNQARLVAQALAQLDVQHAVVAGHSMGGAVATALTQVDPTLIDGLVLVGSSADKDAGELPFLARLGFVPVLGEAIRRAVPDAAVRDNLDRAFADGFKVPDQFVDDFHRMTYSSYDGSHDGSQDFQEERAVADRLAGARKPLLVIQGTEDEIVKPESAQEFRAVRGAQIIMMPGAGHSPMTEKPGQTALLMSRFARRLR